MIEKMDRLPKEATKKMSQAEHIRQDLNEAIQNGITTFEIKGDYYNTKNLAEYVQNEASWLTYRLIKARCREEGYAVHPHYSQHGKLRYIRVHKAEIEGKRHVYVEIDEAAMDKIVDQEIEIAIREKERLDKRRAEKQTLDIS